jgi:hypothetical protein
MMGMGRLRWVPVYVAMIARPVKIPATYAVVSIDGGGATGDTPLLREPQE